MPKTTAITTPEVGDLVRHHGNYYTVTGWLRHPTPPASDDNDTTDAPDEPRPLLFATRENATHVRVRGDTGSGTAVARIADIEPTGQRALFSPNTIRAAHRIAAELDGQPTDQYDSQPEADEEQS